MSRKQRHHVRSGSGRCLSFGDGLPVEIHIGLSISQVRSSSMPSGHISHVVAAVSRGVWLCRLMYYSLITGCRYRLAQTENTRGATV